MKDSDMKFSPACSLDNFLHVGMHFVASVPLSSLLIAWEAEKSCLPPAVGVGRSAATCMGCLFCYRNEAPKTQIDMRFEFRTPKNDDMHTIAYKST